MPDSTLSVIVLTRDDRRFVRDCLDSIREQDRPADEIVVVDCGSFDGTPQVAASVDPGARLVSATAHEDALAAGLRAATGDVVVVTTGRTRLAPGSLRRSVERLHAEGEVAVGGRTVAVGTTNFGRAVASTAAWMPGGPPRPLAWFRTDGGVAPDPGAAALDDGIRAWWFAPQDVSQLAAASFSTGTAAAASGMRAVPPLVASSALLVVASGIGAVAGSGWRRAFLPAAHLAACLGLALRAGRDPGVAPHRALVAIAVSHWCTGAGVLRRLARARPEVTGR